MDVSTSELDLGHTQVERKGTVEGYKGSRICVGFHGPEVETEDSGVHGANEELDV